jgi:hypothetical protein
VRLPSRKVSGLLLAISDDVALPRGFLVDGAFLAREADLH